MDQILLGLGAAGAALLIIAIAVAAWEHRRHKAEMRMQQVWSENTREQLQAYARDVDARLAALATEVHAQRVTAHVPSPTAVAALSHAAAVPSTGAGGTGPAAIGPTTAQVGVAAAAGAAAQVAASQQWVETEPMVLTSQVLTPETHWPRMPDFDPTMPAELSEH
jgi:Flp pilus assembly protein TadB